MRSLATPIVAALGFLLTACPSPPATQGDAGTVTVEPKPPTTAEAKTDAAAPDWAGLHSHMRDHLTQLDRARKALVDGDLTGAKVSYHWLGEHTPVAGLPPGWLPHIEAMQGAAAQGEMAPDFLKAASALGAVAESCGACHRENNAKITFPEVPAPIAATGSAGHMQRHAWSSDRMWEALIIQSEDRWDQGARMLNEPALYTLSNGDALPEGVVAYGERVHELGGEARAEKDWSKRGRLYGDLVSQCANCHSMTGQAPQ